MKKIIAVICLACILLCVPAQAAADNVYSKDIGGWSTYMPLQGEYPSRADLDAVGGDIDYPETKDYLENYRESYVKASKGWGVNAYDSWKADKKIFELLDGTAVLVLAEHGDYSCVIDFSRQSGAWINSKHLDDNYYGRNNPAVSDRRTELESWKDISSVVSVNGSITGIKKDGSTVTVKNFAVSPDVRNWGKLKSLENMGGSFWAVTTSGDVRIYDPLYFCTENYKSYEYYKNEYGRDYLSDQYTNVRYLRGVEMLEFGALGGLALRDDGRVYRLTKEGYILSQAEPWLDSFVYFDSNANKWYYVDNDDGDKAEVTLIKEDGTLDYASEKEYSSKHYDLGNFLHDIVELEGYGDDFIALREDGSIILGGLYAYNYGGLEKYRGRDMSVLYCSGSNVKSIVNETLIITEDGRLVTIDARLGMHPEVTGAWENVAFACTDLYSTIALTEDGRALVDIYDPANSFADKMRDYGQYNLDSWRNVVYIETDCDFSSYDEKYNYAYTLGVTKDGRVLVAGRLPGEGAKALVAAEKENELRAFVGADMSKLGWRISNLIDYSTLLTSTDSPVWVFSTRMDTMLYYSITPNPTLKNSAMYFTAGASDEYTNGEFSHLTLAAPIDQCWSINGVKASILFAEDEEELSSRDWYCAGHIAGSGRWRLGTRHDHIPGESSEMEFYIEDGNYQTIDAIIAAPMNDEETRFYSESGFMISYDLSQIVIATFDEQAARDFLRGIGLENQLW